MKNYLLKKISLMMATILMISSISFAATEDFYTEEKHIDLDTFQEAVEEVPAPAVTETESSEEKSAEELEAEKKAKAEAEAEAKAKAKRTRKVSIIWANLNSPTISVKTAFASEGVGSVATLKDIVDQQHIKDGQIKAAINGGYFEMGGNRQTYGTYLNNGQLVHVGDIGSLATFNGENLFSSMPVFTVIEGAINGQWREPNNFKAWNINHYMDAEDAVLIFDKFYKGVRPAHNYTTITVVDGYVTQIAQGDFNIPDNGFLIFTKSPNQIQKFKIGDKVEFRAKYYPNLYNDNSASGSQLYLNKIKHALGAGPILVKDGQVVVDPVKEKFFEKKITSGPADRSFIGVTDYNMLAMVTVPKVTLKQAAEIAKSMGLVDAINLDGGGSSGLYYDGKYMVPSQRRVANALVVINHSDKAKKLIVNQIEVFSDQREPVKMVDGNYYVLMSDLARGLEAKFSYSPLSKLATVYRYQKRYTMDLNKATVTDDTETVTLDTIPVDDNQFDFYVNVNDFSKILPMEIKYDNSRDILRLQVKTIKSTLEAAKLVLQRDNYTSAVELYKEALVMDYKNITTLNALADINLYNLNKADEAVKYCEKALEFSPNDARILSTYAVALVSSGDSQKAVNTAEKIINLYPNDAYGYYTLGKVMLVKNEKASARTYFSQALEHQASDELKAEINAQLNN